MGQSVTLVHSSEPLPRQRWLLQVDINELLKRLTSQFPQLSPDELLWRESAGRSHDLWDEPV